MRIGFKKSTQLIACLILCFTLCGCDVLYRFLDKEGAQERDLIGDIIPNESNPIVEEAQMLLYIYGFNTGEIDGVLGLRTRNAIAKFQLNNGIKQTRYLDRATWQHLNVFKENGLIVDLQLNIHLIQTLLKEAGFNPGKADGKMGERTLTAVREFQKAQGLKVDGKIGHRTLNKLAAYMQ